jgi:chromate transporter
MSGSMIAQGEPEHRAAAPSHGIPFREAVGVWARIAALSFGGPAGQIALMHRVLVEEKRWIGEGRFLHALNFCMLLPGPEAQQLATYIGWLLHRTKGGLVAGGLFILPGLLAIMALSLIYVAFGTVPAIAALFFGLKAAVLAIVLQAVFRIGTRALKNNVMMAIAAVAFLAIFAFGVPFPAIVLAAGIVGYLGGRAGHPAFTGGGGHGALNKGPVLEDADSALGEDIPAHARPSTAWSLRVGGIFAALWLLPVAALLLLLGPDNVFGQIAVFFSKMAVVTFGGAYAVLAYVAQAAVETYGWLKPGEMLDGLGLAETTPGRSSWSPSSSASWERSGLRAPSIPTWRARSADCSPPG